MCLWQPILWRKLFTCRLPNPCLSPLSQLSSSSERPRVHCDHTRVHNTRPRPPSSTHHHARRQECLQEEERQGGAGCQEDGEDKGGSKAQEREEAKGAEAKSCSKEKGDFFSLFNSNPFSWPGCSGITWISSHFYHQFQFIVVTLCLKAMNKRFVLVYCSSF